MTVRESSSVPAAPPHPRRHLGLEALLGWTYAEQKAHTYLRSEFDWFLQELGEDRALGEDAPRAKVHPDAALVHSAVMREVRLLRRELRRSRGQYVDRGAILEQLTGAEQRAALIVHFAELGERPERVISTPLAYPVEPLNRQFHEYRRGRFDGELIDYVIMVEEMVTVEEEEWRPAGRKHVTRSTKRIRVPVEYCPIDWRPSEEYIAMQEHIAGEWEMAIAAVDLVLAGVELRSHVLLRQKEEQAA